MCGNIVYLTVCTKRELRLFFLIFYNPYVIKKDFNTWGEKKLKK